MGKKKYQSSTRYAKQGSKPKKKAPQQKRVDNGGINLESRKVDTKEAGPSRTRQKASVSKGYNSMPANTQVYEYVVSDLKRIVILSAVMFAILITLAFTVG